MRVLRLAEKGHKILLTGFPGTGKTKLVVNIVNVLITRGGTSEGLQSHQHRGFRLLFRRSMGSVDSKTDSSQMRTL